MSAIADARESNHYPRQNHIRLKAQRLQAMHQPLRRQQQQVQAQPQHPVRQPKKQAQPLRPEQQQRMSRV